MPASFVLTRRVLAWNHRSTIWLSIADVISKVKGPTAGA
jgi:hypothetical protein